MYVSYSESLRFDLKQSSTDCALVENQILILGAWFFIPSPRILILKSPIFILRYLEWYPMRYLLTSEGVSYV